MIVRAREQRLCLHGTAAPLRRKDSLPSSSLLPRNRRSGAPSNRFCSPSFVCESAFSSSYPPEINAAGDEVEGGWGLSSSVSPPSSPPTPASPLSVGKAEEKKASPVEGQLLRSRLKKETATEKVQPSGTAVASARETSAVAPETGPAREADSTSTGTSSAAPRAKPDRMKKFEKQSTTIARDDRQLYEITQEARRRLAEYQEKAQQIVSSWLLHPPEKEWKLPKMTEAEKTIRLCTAQRYRNDPLMKIGGKAISPVDAAAALRRAAAAAAAVAVAHTEEEKAGAGGGEEPAFPSKTVELTPIEGAGYVGGGREFAVRIQTEITEAEEERQQEQEKKKKKEPSKGVDAFVEEPKPRSLGTRVPPPLTEDQISLERLLLERRAEGNLYWTEGWRRGLPRETPEERGTRHLTVRLLQERPPIKLHPFSGSLRQMPSDEELPDPMFSDPTANPNIPLPYLKRRKEEEIYALLRIKKQSRATAEKLGETLPFADYTWSRQPSIDEKNVDRLFRLDGQETLQRFEVTEDVAASHQRLRLAARCVADLAGSSRTDEVSNFWKIKDILAVYNDGPLSPEELQLQQQQQRRHEDQQRQQQQQEEQQQQQQQKQSMESLRSRELRGYEQLHPLLRPRRQEQAQQLEKQQQKPKRDTSKREGEQEKEKEEEKKVEEEEKKAEVQRQKKQQKQQPLEEGRLPQPQASQKPLRTKSESLPRPTKPSIGEAVKPSDSAVSLSLLKTRVPRVPSREKSLAEHMRAWSRGESLHPEALPRVRSSLADRATKAGAAASTTAAAAQETSAAAAAAQETSAATQEISAATQEISAATAASGTTEAPGRGAATAPALPPAAAQRPSPSSENIGEEGKWGQQRRRGGGGAASADWWRLSRGRSSRRTVSSTDAATRAAVFIGASSSVEGESAEAAAREKATAAAGQTSKEGRRAAASSRCPAFCCRSAAGATQPAAAFLRSVSRSTTSAKPMRAPAAAAPDSHISSEPGEETTSSGLPVKRASRGPTTCRPAATAVTNVPLQSTAKQPTRVTLQSATDEHVCCPAGVPAAAAAKNDLRGFSLGDGRPQSAASFSAKGPSAVEKPAATPRAVEEASAADAPAVVGAAFRHAEHHGSSPQVFPRHRSRRSRRASVLLTGAVTTEQTAAATEEVDEEAFASLLERDGTASVTVRRPRGVSGATEAPAAMAAAAECVLRTLHSSSSVAASRVAAAGDSARGRWLAAGEGAAAAVHSVHLHAAEPPIGGGLADIHTSGLSVDESEDEEKEEELERREGGGEDTSEGTGEKHEEPCRADTAVETEEDDYDRAAAAAATPPTTGAAVLHHVAACGTLSSPASGEVGDVAKEEDRGEEKLEGGSERAIETEEEEEEHPKLLRRDDATSREEEDKKGAAAVAATSSSRAHPREAPVSTAAAAQQKKLCHSPTRWVSAHSRSKFGWRAKIAAGSVRTIASSSPTAASDIPGQSVQSVTTAAAAASSGPSVFSAVSSVSPLAAAVASAAALPVALSTAAPHATAGPSAASAATASRKASPTYTAAAVAAVPGEENLMLEEAEARAYLRQLRSTAPPPPMDAPALPFCGSAKSVALTRFRLAYAGYALSAAEEQEDISRLRLLQQLLQDLSLHLGPAWRKELPDTSLLAKILAAPSPRALRKIFLRSGQELLPSLPDGVFWAELLQCIWVPLLLQRVTLFSPLLEQQLLPLPCIWDPDEQILNNWSYFAAVLPRMHRLSNYLLTGILETRVPGMHRLLFRLNALLYFAYRIEGSIFFGSDSAGRPHLLSLKEERRFLRPASCIAGDKRDTSKQQHKRNSSTTRGGSNTSRGIESSHQGDDSSYDRMYWAAVARKQLGISLQSSITCHALCYNMNAISLLWPFVMEIQSTSCSLSKEELCRRMFAAPFTHGFFLMLANNEVPDSPAAVACVSSFLKLLTNILYGGRSRSLLTELVRDGCAAGSTFCLWHQLVQALQQQPSAKLPSRLRQTRRELNVFLVREVLLFLVDLLLLSCMDGAPVPRSAAEELLVTLNTYVLNTLVMKRPLLCNEETWGDATAIAASLRDALLAMLEGKPIPLQYLEVFACRGRLVEWQDPSSPWPSMAELHPLPSHLPCWRPGCNADLYLTEENARTRFAASTRYCKGCYVATYCSSYCQALHWTQGHSLRCKFLRCPPTCLRFYPELMKGEKIAPACFPQSLLLAEVFRDLYPLQAPDRDAFQPIL